MKIDRLVSISMILLDKKRIGAQELADMFEVSPRTIYRDIDTINMAGIPVLSTSGVGGGFEIMQKYKIDRNVPMNGKRFYQNHWMVMSGLAFDLRWKKNNAQSLLW